MILLSLVENIVALENIGIQFFLHFYFSQTLPHQLKRQEHSTASFGAMLTSGCSYYGICVVGSQGYWPVLPRKLTLACDENPWKHIENKKVFFFLLSEENKQIIWSFHLWSHHTILMERYSATITAEGLKSRVTNLKEKYKPLFMNCSIFIWATLRIVWIFNL